LRGGGGLLKGVSGGGGVPLIAEDFKIAVSRSRRGQRSDDSFTLRTSLTKDFQSSRGSKEVDTPKLPVLLFSGTHRKIFRMRLAGRFNLGKPGYGRDVSGRSPFSLGY